MRRLRALEDLGHALWDNAWGENVREKSLREFIFIYGYYFKMQKMKIINLLLCLFISSISYSQDISFQKIPSRAGVTQGFLYSAPAQPFASAVLLQGGSGSIGAAGTKERGWSKIDGFLSSGTSRFAENGISAAATDAPSDRGDLNNGFRSSVEHVRLQMV